MHFLLFCWILMNMEVKYSSFLNLIPIVYEWTFFLTNITSMDNDIFFFFATWACA